MPTTRKKVIKTVYKNEDDSDPEHTGDFSDSGSDAQISDQRESSEDYSNCEENSADEVEENSSKEPIKNTKRTKKKVKFAKSFISKIRNQRPEESDNEDDSVAPVFSVKDLSAADKLLPSFLNLSESDSSDDDKPTVSKRNDVPSTSGWRPAEIHDNETEMPLEYKDVWSENKQDNSEEVAKQSFQQLLQHANKIKETKTNLQKYTVQKNPGNESDVKDLLALGEEATVPTVVAKKTKTKKLKNDSDSDMEDWEEVTDSKPIPQQGIQLVVDYPDAAYRKSKTVDIDMMMRRKINRVKKEYQVYMHKVHVLCWLGHGNYVSKVLNNQRLLAATLSLIPSKSCYPGTRVDVKYVEQITKWYRNKMSLNQDKNENKFKPKAPPLNEILLKQANSRVVTNKKYLVFLFVCLLRALGLQCRVVFNFVTLPLKPPTSELCSLSTKNKNDSLEKSNKSNPGNENKNKKKAANKPEGKGKRKTATIPQIDGNVDLFYLDNSDSNNIVQLDGNNDKSKSKVTPKAKPFKNEIENKDVSPPKRARIVKSEITKTQVINKNQKEIEANVPGKRKRLTKNSQSEPVNEKSNEPSEINIVETNAQENIAPKFPNTLKSRQTIDTKSELCKQISKRGIPKKEIKPIVPPKVTIIDEVETKSNVSSKYFNSKNISSTTNEKSQETKNRSLTRKRSNTTTPKVTDDTNDELNNKKTKSRTKSAHSSTMDTSKYFTDAKKKKLNKSDCDGDDKVPVNNKAQTARRPRKTRNSDSDDELRVSHKDLRVKTRASNKVMSHLVDMIKNRIEETQIESIKKVVKGKVLDESEDDNEMDFKPAKIINKSLRIGNPKIDRRVLSSDEETKKENKTDVWCEVYIEELEQWIAVDVFKTQVHCTNEVYGRATHPVAYIVGWDNNNNLKDVTRRYVPHWNTNTRKLRAEPVWWDQALRPWLGQRTALDKEEDEYLDRLQLEAPLPKSIAEYKNHPLYALKRHLLKFEAIYPPEAATLGFVRGEAVYDRLCIYTCRSRDTWLKEAKVVRLGEQPYKIVKARPKWDRLSNKMITDIPLEVFGPWQVQDYEPPVAEDGIVPRNAYGNVELFKECMLPKGTAHIKLPGLNKVAKKLGIDCAPAMTGFDFNGGWTHPVYDGFVVCKEFEEIITDAWIKEQEEQERKEKEKMEARVYGHWKRLIKGLLIRERLKSKYGFVGPTSTNDPKKKSKGPRLVVKKN